MKNKLKLREITFFIWMKGSFQAEVSSAKPRRIFRERLFNSSNEAVEHGAGSLNHCSREFACRELIAKCTAGATIDGVGVCACMQIHIRISLRDVSGLSPKSILSASGFDVVRETRLSKQDVFAYGKSVPMCLDTLDNTGI